MNTSKCVYKMEIDMSSIGQLIVGPNLQTRYKR